MDDRFRPVRLVAVLTLSITVGLAAVAGRLVNGQDLMAALGSGLVMALVEGTLRALLAGNDGRPGTGTPPADPDISGSQQE